MWQLDIYCSLSGSQREFDEDEVDPYHGQQDKRPEPEAMDLPEDLNLDQQDEAGDDGDGQGDGKTCWHGDRNLLDLVWRE